ncbi:MAG: DUF116 domain-containing protein, partial [Candidatus Fermentibacter sp.]|nr:DUF116 domain-containing protein [Candidatus Fermentibacter sp.]
MARSVLLFRAGLLGASMPFLLVGLLLMAATGGAGWAALSAAAVLLPQIAASASMAPGMRRLLIGLLGVSYHALRIAMPPGAKKALLAETMVVEVNDRALEGVLRSGGLTPDRVLLLLPHCLQTHVCVHRIVHDHSLCTRCGACDMAALLELAGKRGIGLSIATGGTAARRAVEEARPGMVVAVACPRDLSSGILDSASVPVYGVLNSRPNGDCFDTRVDTSLIAVSYTHLRAHETA